MKTLFARLFSVVSLLAVVSVTQPQPRTLRNPAQKQSWDKPARRFGQLWLQRRTRKVAPELIKMLAAERSPGFQEAIIIALGRLEDPKAIKPLRARLVTLRSNSNSIFSYKGEKREIPVFRVQLALGRIQARQLRGRPKLDAIAKSIGTTWPALQGQARRLRSELQDRLKVYKAQEDPNRFVLEEFYDILYVMGKRGENIKKLGAFDLMIWSNDPSNVAAGLRSQEQAKLFAASLSNQAEIEFWLGRSMPPNKFRFSPAHLLDLGPQVPQSLRKHLKIYLREAKANPRNFARTKSYRSLFQTVAATNDSRFVPLLKEFLSVEDQWVKNFAGDAITAIQQQRGLALIKFP